MPFNHWVVEPQYLSRKELDKSCYDELEAVTNNTLVAVIQQLACVAKYAEWIFEAVSQDLKQVQNRSKTLKVKIDDLTERAACLNAKNVLVPVGDLTSFSQLKDHYASTQPLDTALFTSAARPLCVQLMYEDALVSPVHIMREIDQYREDGCRTSKYFVCTPILEGKGQVDLEIETRLPASILTARSWQSDEELGIPEDIKDKANATKKHQNELVRLPSPQERVHALSLKYPSSYVPIDTTGFSFRRMANFRRSLVQQVEFFTRRKKKKKTKKDRRNTISGGADVEAALEQMGQSEARATLTNQKHKRFSMVESSRPFKPIEHTYSSLRLPAQNKSVQTGEEDSGPNGSSGSRERIYETLKEKKDTQNPQDSGKRNKARHKSNIPIATLSQAMSVAVRLRETGNRSSGKNEDSGQSSSGNWSASSSTRASVESEHIAPQTTSPELGRTSSQTSLSKDSALSETTTPIEDLRALAGPIKVNERDTTAAEGQSGGQITGKPGSLTLHLRSDISSAGTSVSQQNVPVKTSNTSTSMDTAKWLRNLRDDVQLAGDTTDGTSTTGTLTPLLGKRALSPFEIPLAFMDDEESSVYSVDTDGYYTSMHTDSGLRSMSGGSKPPEAIAEVNDTCSTLSSVSSIEQTDSEGKSNPSSVQPKKTPPPPPARNSSLSRKDLAKRAETDTKAEAPVAEPQQPPAAQNPSPSSRSSSLSESDVEIKEHFKDKTAISASRIPSMCIVTPSGSDDEDQKSEREQKPRDSPTENLKSTVEAVQRRLDECDAADTGFHTLPRNFGKNWSFSTFSNYNTNSWPRSVSSPSSGKGKSSNKKSLARFNSYSLGHRSAAKNDSSSSSSSDINECKEDGESGIPRLPLKYVQHITITPGGRSSASQDGASSSVMEANHVPKSRLHPVPGSSLTGSVGLTTTAVSRGESKGYVTAVRPDHKPIASDSHADTSGSSASTSKVIHATNSMERKKNNVNNGRGAHVVLDPSGHVIHTTNSLTRKGSLTAEPQTSTSPIQAAVTEPPPAIVGSNTSGQPQRLGTIESSFCTSRTSGVRSPQPESSHIPRRVSYADSRPAQTQRTVAAAPAVAYPVQPYNSRLPTVTSHGQPPNSRLSAPSCLTRSVSFRHPVAKYDHNTLPRTRISKSEPPSPLFPSSADARNYDLHSATLPRHSPAATHYSPPNQPLNASLSDSDSQPSPKSQKDMPPPMTLISPSAQQASRRWAHTPPPMSPPPSTIQPLHPPIQTSTPRLHNNPGTVTPPVRPRPIYYSGSQTLDFRSDPLQRPSMLPQPSSAHNGRPITPVYPKSSMIPQPQVPVTRQQEPPPYTPPPHGNYPNFARPSVAPPATEIRYQTSNGIQQAPNGVPLQTRNVYPPAGVQQHSRQSPQYSQRSESPQMYAGPQPPQRRYVLTPTPNGDQRSPSPYNYSIHEASPTPSLVRMTPQHVDWSVSQPTTMTDGQTESRMGNGHVSHVAPPPGRNGYVVNGYTGNGHTGNGQLPNRTYVHSVSANNQTPNRASGEPPNTGRCGTPQPMSTLEKKSKSKMSTDDLFAAIHQSKKRLNIKSDADRSLSPTSSRSASPALSVASYSSRSSAPETGVLSPRVLLPGDRRSWSGDMTVPQSPAGKGHDRRSWAVDRLGPSKPTTMHDFKMLLLQAGRAAPKEERQRPSALEMLKVSSPVNDAPIRTQSPANNGYQPSMQPQQLQQQQWQQEQHYQQPPPLINKQYGYNGNLPVQPVYDVSSDQRNYYNNNVNNIVRTPPRNNGHSPGLQYGRGRNRPLFHTRTDILSTPIWEDNMEDCDSSGSDGESPQTLSRTNDASPSSARFVA